MTAWILIALACLLLGGLVAGWNPRVLTHICSENDIERNFQNIRKQLDELNEAGNIGREATATANWATGSPPTVAATDDATSAVITVQLPRTTPGDPNVRNGGAILYFVNSAGNNISMGAHMSDKIGTIKWWSLLAGDIPGGWVKADGTANSAGSGINCMKFIKGNATASAGSGASSTSSDAIGSITSGGPSTDTTDTSGAGTSDEPSANVTGASSATNTGTGGAHSHSAATGLTVSGVTIVAHPPHYHSLISVTGTHQSGTNAPKNDPCTSREKTTSCSSNAILGHPVVEPNSGTGHLHTISSEAAHQHSITHTHDLSAHTHATPTHSHTLSDHTHSVTGGSHSHTAGEPNHAKLIPIERLT
jgi:hypothetical protein